MEASPKFTTRRGPFAGSRLLQTQPDAVLCRLAMRGNPGAYEALYNRHHGALYGFVFHLLGRGATAEDAEDIAQESFTTAFNKLADRRDDGSFKSWLFTIARNRTYDLLRGGRPQMADVTELPIAASGGPEHQAESRAEMAWLVTAMGDLPERQREALVMREMGGLSYSEIAAGMETTVPGVKQLINRARGTLSDAADGDGLRPRRLRKELAALVPVIPLAVTSAGVAAFGVAGTATGVAAGAGGFSGAAKLAAVALTAAAIGGGAAGLTAATGDDGGVHSASGPAGAGGAIENFESGDDESGGGSSDSHRGSGDDSPRSGSGDSGSGDDSGDRSRDGSRRGRRDDSGEDDHESLRRESRSGSSDDDSRSGSGDDGSGSGSGGSGDDEPDRPDEPDEPDSPDEPEADSPDDDHSGSGSNSGSGSLSSGSSSLEIGED